MRIKDFIHDLQFQAKRVDQGFYKIPRAYYWIWGGVVPATIFSSVFYLLNPSLISLEFIYQSIISFLIVTSAVTIFFVCCSVLVLMFGILFTLVIKDNREKIAGIKKAIVDILTYKDSNTDSEVTGENLRKVMSEELEEIMKKYSIIPDKPTKQAFSEIFVRLDDLESQNKSLKKEVQRLTKGLIKSQNQEKKSWFGFWK